MTSLITDYVALADLKNHLRIRLANTDDDTELSLVITAASRAIDAATYRRFGQSPAASSRLFTWDGQCIDGRPALVVDDFMVTGGLVVTVDYAGDYSYSTTVAINTNFDLYPYNAAADLKPWTHMLVRPTGSATYWPSEARSVTVVAQWGWATIPSLVEVACLIQASRWFMRRDSWAGIAGSPDLGSEVRLLAKLDADVMAALAPVTRYWGAV